eukprot:TRINITY_DN48966_c0_g1_i1.p1 TRINITY_DN48966_c0_g1~~TRINITY_DN48966_c0_g1_i1.p1  ORF type:complete len:539 (-),score=109.66 TRINITY_DN48966_c0_g1_i1:379-1995(-)
MIRRPPRSTLSSSSAASDVYKRQVHDSGVADVSFSDDERLLATVGDVVDKQIYVWDMSNGSVVANKYASPDPTSVICWGGHQKDIKKRATQNYVLCAIGSKEVRLWTLDPYSGDLSAESCNLGAQVRDWTDVAFSADKDFMYAASTTGDFICIQVRSLIIRSIFSVCSGGCTSLIALPQGGVLVGGGDGSITMFSGQGEALVDDRRVFVTGGVNALSLSADGTHCLAGSSQGYIYSVTIPEMVANLHSENPPAAVTCVGFPIGVSDRFATGCADGTIRVWDLNDYSVPTRAFVRDGGEPVCLDYAIECILSGWQDGLIRCHDCETGEMLWQIQEAHRGGVTALRVSHNQRFFISGGQEGDVRVWDIKSREMVCNLKEHKQVVTQVVCFADDTLALSCSRDKSIMCWDLRDACRITGLVQKMGGINCLALCADQNTFLTGGQEKKITYWDVREPDPVQTIDPAHVDAEAMCMTISHSGEYLATGGTDQQVKLWKLSTGELIVDGTGHSATVNGLAFSPDDRQLISVGDDGNILVWNVYE